MAEIVYEDVLEQARKLSERERIRLIADIQNEFDGITVTEDSKADFTDKDLSDLVTHLGESPLTGKEIVAAGLTGGWEDLGITDSVEWLAEQRARFERKPKWQAD